VPSSKRVKISANDEKDKNPEYTTTNLKRKNK
jgi:hypothetical protein